MTRNKKLQSITASQLFIATLVLLVLLFLTDVATAACGNTGVVGVNEAPIRNSPAAFGAKSGKTLKLGEKVRIAGSQGAFCKVTAKGVTGWVAASAFATDADSAVYRAGKGGAVVVNEREAAAAGKGFNEKYEQAYKNKHAQADFAAVDQLQGMSVSEERLLRFRNDGRLGEGNR